MMGRNIEYKLTSVDITEYKNENVTIKGGKELDQVT